MYFKLLTSQVHAQLSQIIPCIFIPDPNWPATTTQVRQREAASSISSTLGATARQTSQQGNEHDSFMILYNVNCWSHEGLPKRIWFPSVLLIPRPLKSMCWTLTKPKVPYPKRSKQSMTELITSCCCHSKIC